MELKAVASTSRASDCAMSRAAGTQANGQQIAE
jgi:hypothetical protein